MLFLRLERLGRPSDVFDFILKSLGRTMTHMQLLLSMLPIYLGINLVLFLFKPLFELWLESSLYCKGLLFDFLLFALYMFVVIHQLWLELLNVETIRVHPSFGIVENAELVFLWSLVNPVESLQHLLLIPLVHFPEFRFLLFKYSQASDIILEIEVEIFGVQFGF